MREDSRWILLKEVNMLKTNVIKKTYRFTLRAPSGATAAATVDAESEAAARLKAPCPPGWIIEAVTEC